MIQFVFPQMDEQQSSVKKSGLLSLLKLSVDRTTCKIPSILARLEVLLYVSTQIENTLLGLQHII